jgi:hypothetical protein
MPAVINLRHLHFEDQNGPTLEIRWNSSSYSLYTHGVIFRRLHQVAKIHRCKLQEIPVPKTWQKALIEFNVKAFCWQNKNFKAKGAVIICPHCNRVTVLQFYYSHTKIVNDEFTGKVIATFQDHPKNDTIQWAIFDIQVNLARTFQLIKQRFNAGFFQLNFKNKNIKINLYRFAPASIILNKMSFYQFALLNWPVVDGQALDNPNSKDCHLEYPTTLTIPFYRRIIHKILGVNKKARICAWHLHRANRIFAVRIEGKDNHIKTILASIVRNYSHVQQ